MIIIMVIRSKPVLWDSIVSPHLPRSESWKSELSNLDQQSRGAFAFWRLPRAGADFMCWKFTCQTNSWVYALASNGIHPGRSKAIG